MGFLHERKSMKTLGQSSEDYLEAILILRSQIPSVHNIDIASFLGFSKSSVSTALKHLKADGLIEILENRSVVLTSRGEKKAESVYQRHRFFTELLEKIGVDPQIAEEDACRLEHVISDETFQAIRSYYKNH